MCLRADTHELSSDCHQGDTSSLFGGRQEDLAAGLDLDLERRVGGRKTESCSCCKRQRRWHEKLSERQYLKTPYVCFHKVSTCIVMEAKQRKPLWVMHMSCGVWCKQVPEWVRMRLSPSVFGHQALSLSACHHTSSFSLCVSLSCSLTSLHTHSSHANHHNSTNTIDKYYTVLSQSHSQKLLCSIWCKSGEHVHSRTAEQPNRRT